MTAGFDNYLRYEIVNYPVAAKKSIRHDAGGGDDAGCKSEYGSNGLPQHDAAATAHTCAAAALCYHVAVAADDDHDDDRDRVFL